MRRQVTQLMMMHRKRKSQQQWEYEDSDSSLKEDGGSRLSKMQATKRVSFRSDALTGLDEDSSKKIKISVRPLFKNDLEEGRYKVIKETVTTYNLPAATSSHILPPFNLTTGSIMSKSNDITKSSTGHFEDKRSYKIELKRENKGVCI